MSKLLKLFESALYKEYKNHLNKIEESGIDSDNKVNVEILGNGTVIMKKEFLNQTLSKIDEHELERAISKSQQHLKKINSLKNTAEEEPQHI